MGPMYQPLIMTDEYEALAKCSVTGEFYSIQTKTYTTATMSTKDDTKWE